MDFSIKVIPVFFALVLLANYFNFISFWLMLRHLPRVKGRSLRKRTKCYFATMNLLYVAVVVMSFFPPFQPKCTQEKAYPYVMSWASFLFAINYCFHWVVNCRKEFWLKPIEEQAEACEAANSAINSELTKAMEPLMSSKDGDEKTTSTEAYPFNWSVPHQARRARADMFRRQMWFYLCFSTVLVTFHITLQCWGRFHAHGTQRLGCAPGGYRWLYSTTYAELFITAHIIQIIMQAVMLEKAVLSVPEKIGLFAAPENAEFSSDSEEEGVESTPGDDADENFKR